MRAKEKINPADAIVIWWVDGRAFQAAPQMVRTQLKKIFHRKIYCVILL